MSYPYLRDPLFRLSVALYIANRWFFKGMTNGGFLHNSFNDLLCIPLLVPILVWMARRLNLRDHDGAPTAAEVMIPLIVWSILFEIVFPTLPYWERYVTGDPEDIPWYSAGALLGSLYWQRGETLRRASTA